MAIGIEDRVVVAASAWPARSNVAPGDLTKYAPIGLAMGAPLVVAPWDDLGRAMDRGGFYGASERTGDPFRDAPVNDPAGGTIYFDSRCDASQLAGALALLDVRTAVTSYAVYAAESSDPKVDRYLAQIRIVDFEALHLFGAIPNPDDALSDQKLTIGQLISAFIEAQETTWGRGMSSALEGTLGGDGDWAREKLSFGLLVENASNGVYRLWSRPWLVTK